MVAYLLFWFAICEVAAIVVSQVLTLDIRPQEFSKVGERICSGWAKSLTWWWWWWWWLWWQ